MPLSNMEATVPTVRVRSCEGDIFEVDVRAACVSKLMKDMIDDSGVQDEIPVPGIHTAPLGEVLDFCCKHQGDEKSICEHVDPLLQELSDWDAQYMRNYRMASEIEQCNLLKAANFLNVKGLLSLIQIYTRSRNAWLELASRSPVRFENSPKWIRAEQAIALKVLESRGSMLALVSDELKADCQVVTTAVRASGLALMFASAELRADRDVVMLAVQQNGLALEDAAPQLQDDAEIVLSALQTDGIALEYASRRLRADRSIVSSAVHSDGLSLRYAEHQCRADHEIVLTAVLQRGEMLNYASDNLRSDHNIALSAVLQNASAICFIPEELRNKPDFQAAVGFRGARRKAAKYFKRKRCKRHHMQLEQDLTSQGLGASLWGDT